MNGPGTWQILRSGGYSITPHFCSKVSLVTLVTIIFIIAGVQGGATPLGARARLGGWRVGFRGWLGQPIIKLKTNIL